MGSKKLTITTAIVREGEHIPKFGANARTKIWMKETNSHSYSRAERILMQFWLIMAPLE